MVITNDSKYINIYHNSGSTTLYFEGCLSFTITEEQAELIKENLDYAFSQNLPFIDLTFSKLKHVQV
jgi:hypothetical protein